MEVETNFENNPIRAAGKTCGDGIGQPDILQQTSTNELMKLEEPEPMKYYFGVRFWHPTWLQILANANFFTFLLCLDGLVEGALASGFSSIVVTSLERRFRFSSTAVGFLLVSLDIAVLCSVIFISYFGEKRNKPRWIGYGLILQGIGSLVYSSPQYIFGSYPIGLAGNLTLEACELTSDVPADCGDFNSLAYFILLLGNTLIGVGIAPLFTLGLSYIDDINLPRSVPIHIGIFYVSVAIGPAIGYGLGGIFLSIYVDPWVETYLQETDPGWVGAWWICFVLSGILSLILAVPFFLFPRLLANHQEVVESHKNQHAANYTSKYENEDTVLDQLKAFPMHMHVLCKSPSFIFVTAGLSFLFLTLYGLVSFGPKFIESVFNIPASTSSLLAGAVAIPAGGIGTIVGSIAAYVLKSDTKKVAIIPWACSLLIIPAIFGFFISCPSATIAGINTPHSNVSLSFEDVTISACNRDCMCTSSIYEPVCGSDDVTYFSSCRAGCQKKIDESDPNVPIFENCICVRENLMARNYSGSLVNSTASNGKCPQKCSTLGLWLFLIGFVIFFIFVMRIPTLLITIRSVAEEQRSLALGVQSVLWRALGSIPGPLLFGVIFDSSCVYWQEECNRRGNCWVYNNSFISIRSFFMSITGVLINTVCMILSWVFYPPVTCKAVKTAIEDDTRNPQAEEVCETIANTAMDARE